MMDDLIRALREAGLSDEQAKRAADAVAELLKDEEKRKKIIAATAAVTAATTSVVFSGSR